MLWLNSQAAWLAALMLEHAGLITIGLGVVMLILGTAMLMYPIQR